MGGILVKQLRRHATSFGVDRWESIATRTAGVAFVATPHSGADIAAVPLDDDHISISKPASRDAPREATRGSLRNVKRRRRTSLQYDFAAAGLPKAGQARQSRVGAASRETAEGERA